MIYYAEGLKAGKGKVETLERSEADYERNIVLPKTEERAEEIKNVAEDTFNNGVQVVVDDASADEIETVAELKADG